MAEDYTYEIGEIGNEEREYPPQWVRDYIYANQDANLTAWGGYDVSFNVTSATESYGKGTYILSANLVRESTAGNVGLSTDKNYAMTNLFNNAYNEWYFNTPYFTGWQTKTGSNLTNSGFSIDLTPTLTITSDSDIPVVTIEFPDALQITKYTLWGANVNGTYAAHYLFGYDEGTSVYDLLNHSTDTLNNTSATYNVNSAGKVYKKYAFTPSSPSASERYITPELRFFGYVASPTPSSLTFTDDILTIENSIDATDTDPVSFVLPVGYEMSNLNVTNFSGTGTVTYTLSTDGATDITGTFSAIGDNLLAGNLLAPGADATYTLTLTADAAITYTIVGTKTVDYGVITYGTPDWSTLSKTTISPDVPIASARFGSAIAISGNYAIVSALTDNKAYIFEKNGLGGWSQVSVLEHTLNTVSNFGYSVAIDGDYAIVGASNTPSLGGNTWTDGSAHIFERDSSGVWSEVVMLQPSAKLEGTGSGDKYARFGSSVAIDGDYVAIGATTNGFYHQNSNFGGSTNGSAHIYKRDGNGNWNEFDDVIFFNTDLSTRLGGNASFGSTIVLQGDDLFVGTGGTSNQGGCILYVFKMNSGGTGFEPAQHISPTGDDGFSKYGLAVNGDYMIVGAIYDDYNNNSLSNAGAMYTYARNSSGVWEKKQYLHVQDPAVNDNFGWSIAMHGDKAIVSSRYKNGPENAYSGVAVVYERTGNNWTQIQYIEPTSYGDQFGYAVAMDGDDWLVGEPYEDSGGVVYWYGPNIPIILNPTPLTFTDDILTIENSISQNDTDPVSFVLPVGYEMSNLDVTNFSGTGTVSYTLSTDGATDITGTFSAKDVNILDGNPLVPGADATYTLTLTADAAITYTIVGTKTVDYDYTVEIVEGSFEHPPSWVRSYMFDNSANPLWVGTDLSFNVTSATELYGQGTYTLSCSHIRKDSTSNYPGSFGMTVPFNTDMSLYASGWPVGWWVQDPAAGNMLTNANFSIDLTPTLNLTTTPTPVLTIEFPYTFKITKYTLWGGSNGQYPYHYLFAYDEDAGVYDLLKHSTLQSNTTRTYTVNTAGKRYKKYAFTTGQSLTVQTIVPELRFYGDYSKLLPAPLTFTDDILTIENSIDATDTDPVSFVLPVGYEMSNLNVTNFSGTGTVSYTLSTDGATDITGTFSAIGDNLLAGNPLAPGADATYTLTLTADAAITYTIVGTKTVDYGIVNSVNIRNIYDTAGPFTNGQDGILENSGAKIEFFLGTTGTSYLPFRNNQSYFYTWWSTNAVPNAFVAELNATATGRFPCIGTVISDGSNEEGGAYLGSDWLAFHPASGSSGSDSTKLRIKITPIQSRKITGYTLYFGATGNSSCGFTITTNTETHLTRTAVTAQSSTASTGWTYVGTEDQYTKVHKYTKNEINITENDYIDIIIDDNGNFGDDAGVLKIILHVSESDTLTFTDDILTIENSIDATDTDPVSFVLPIGYSMSNLNVTNFSGTGTVTYTLSTDGATDITGTFNAKDVNILDGTPIFAIASDTTYTLTLTADAAINYTIMGTRLYTMSSSEYSVSQLITAGYTQQQLLDGNFWIADDSANRFLPIYNGLLDVSGGNMIVRDNFIMGSGNIDLSNALITQSCTFNAVDITVNNNLFVTGDVSMGAVGLNVAGDITIDGNLSTESYKDNSISPSAIKSDADGSITESNMTAIMNDSSYDKLQMNGDVSLNATVSTPGYSITLETVANTVPLLESNDYTSSPSDAITLNASNSKTVSTAYQSYQGNIPILDHTGRLVGLVREDGKGYLSTNYGSSTFDIGSNVIGIGISDDASHICKVQMDTGISISTDEGSTWTNTYTNFSGITFGTYSGGNTSSPSDNECGVSMSGNGQYIVVIPSKNTNVLFSNDFGATWSSKFSVGNNTRNNTNMSISGQYICIHESTGTGKIWMSNDYGVTFLENSVTSSSNSNKHISMSSSGEYIAIRNHWGSKDYGVTWGSYGGSLRYGNVAHDKRFEGQTHAIWGPNPNIQVCTPMWNPLLFISVDGGATYNIGSTQIPTATGWTYSGDGYKIITMALSNDGKNLYFTQKLGRRVVRINIDGIGYTPPVYQASSDKVTYFGASTKLKLTNGIQLSDNTIVNTTNISSGTYATNNVVFKPSHFDNMTVTGDFASNPPLSASDYRIKTNIQELDETHTIDKLRPVTYYQTQMKKNAIGFIAHELQEHYPELVEGEKDGDKMQSVNYTGILAVLINEIKQLKKNIKDTRNTLSSQNSAL